MRQLLLAAFAAASLSMAACAGPSNINDKATNPAETPPPNYFPLIAGAEYKTKRYTYYFSGSESGEFTGYELTRVIAVEQSGATATASLQTISLNKEEKQVGSPSDFSYFLKGDGLYQTVGNAEPEKSLVWPIVDGTHVIPTTVEMDRYEFSDVSQTISSGHKIETPAGIFDNTILVTNVSTSKYLGSTPTTDSTTSHKIWLAPNVGLIKGRTDKETKFPSSSSFSSSGFELATFSVPVTNP